MAGNVYDSQLLLNKHSDQRRITNLNVGVMEFTFTRHSKLANPTGHSCML